jgi:hypothetical protein
MPDALFLQTEIPWHDLKGKASSLPLCVDGNAWKHSLCCERTRGPSTPQNRSLRERFCSAQDDRVKLGSGCLISLFLKPWHPRL